MKKKCAVCLNLFETSNNKSSGINRRKITRPKNCLTCSTKCSKIYKSCIDNYLQRKESRNVQKTSQEEKMNEEDVRQQIVMEQLIALKEINYNRYKKIEWDFTNIMYPSSEKTSKENKEVKR